MHNNLPEWIQSLLFQLFIAFQEKWIDWIVGFILGVISSILAEIIWLRKNSKTYYSNAINSLIKRRSIERLKRLQSNNNLNPSDPHAVVRADWVCSIYDLFTNDIDNVGKALKSLYFMADLLTSEERDVAYEALRIKIGTNQNRNLDSEYTKTMTRLQL